MKSNHKPVQISKTFHRELLLFCNQHYEEVGTRLSINKLLQIAFNFYIFNKRFLDITDYDETPENIHSIKGQLSLMHDELEKITKERNYLKGWRGGIKKRLSLAKPINAAFLRELDQGLKELLKEDS